MHGTASRLRAASRWRKALADKDTLVTRSSERINPSIVRCQAEDGDEIGSRKAFLRQKSYRPCGADGNVTSVAMKERDDGRPSTDARRITRGGEDAGALAARPNGKASPSTRRATTDLAHDRGVERPPLR